MMLCIYIPFFFPECSVEAHNDWYEYAYSLYFLFFIVLLFSSFVFIPFSPFSRSPVVSSERTEHVGSVALAPESLPVRIQQQQQQQQHSLVQTD